MLTSPLINSAPASPTVPVDCAQCPIRELTVCRPFRGPALNVVQNFKEGDRLLPAGSHLFFPGQRIDELYNLLDGWVALYRIFASGRRQIVDFALPGAFLGYQPELDAPMLIGAECLTDVAVCIFPRKTFHDLAARHTVLSLQLAKINAEAMIRAHAKLASVGARSAVECTAHLILEILMRLNGEELRSLRREFHLPLTQTHIAEALGFSSVYVNKTLRELRERRVAILKGHQLTVLDPVKLAELAEIDLDPTAARKKA